MLGLPQAMASIACKNTKGHTYMYAYMQSCIHKYWRTNVQTDKETCNKTNHTDTQTADGAQGLVKLLGSPGGLAGVNAALAGTGATAQQPKVTVPEQISVQTTTNTAGPPTYPPGSNLFVPASSGSSSSGPALVSDNVLVVSGSAFLQVLYCTLFVCSLYFGLFICLFVVRFLLLCCLHLTPNVQFHAGK